jgi:son of sevenless-like protein
MNNFSSMAGVVAGLNAAPVDRLKRTKELLSTKTLLLKSELDRTMDSSKNFLNYKEALKTINPPCVPFFGMSTELFSRPSRSSLPRPCSACSDPCSSNRD